MVWEVSAHTTRYLLVPFGYDLIPIVAALGTFVFGLGLERLMGHCWRDFVPEGAFEADHIPSVESFEVTVVAAELGTFERVEEHGSGAVGAGRPRVGH